jgi:branched-chain amino acid transport system ATP-binding protein
MSAILVATGVNKSFGAVTAAADINLAIDRGAVVALIGGNGAGKTTFLNMVTGYLQPSSGSIQLDGRELTGLSPRQVTRLGISRSFQIPQLLATLSVRENLLVAEGIAGTERAEEATEQMLAQFGLASYAPRAAGLLPEGVRKLLDVAMALVTKPRVLLLDEPTSGVAADDKFEIMDLVMGAVRGAGVTVLFVEHDMDVVTRYSQRVVAFYDGRVIADAAPSAALASDAVRKYVIGEEDHRAAA